MPFLLTAELFAVFFGAGFLFLAGLGPRSLAWEGLAFLLRVWEVFPACTGGADWAAIRADLRLPTCPTACPCLCCALGTGALAAGSGGDSGPPPRRADCCPFDLVSLFTPFCWAGRLLWEGELCFLVGLAALDLEPSIVKVVGVRLKVTDRPNPLGPGVASESSGFCSSSMILSTSSRSPYRCVVLQ